MHLIIDKEDNYEDDVARVSLNVTAELVSNLKKAEALCASAPYVREVTINCDCSWFEGAISADDNNLLIDFGNDAIEDDYDFDSDEVACALSAKDPDENYAAINQSFMKVNKSGFLYIEGAQKFDGKPVCSKGINISLVTRALPELAEKVPSPSGLDMG